MRLPALLLASAALLRCPRAEPAEENATEAPTTLQPAVREERAFIPVANYTVVLDVPLQRRGFSIGAAGTYVLAGAFLCIQLAACVLCSLACWEGLRQDAFGMLRRGYRTLRNEEELDEDQRQGRLGLEAALALAAPWVALGAGYLWVRLRADSPPLWLLLALALAISLRSTVLEFTLCKRFGLEPFSARQILAFLLSKLELQDAVSDGLAVAAAAALPASSQERFLASLGAWAPLQWLLERLGLMGLAAGVLAFATVMQAMLVLYATGNAGNLEPALLADLAGLGALEKRLFVAEEGEGVARLLALAVARVLGEAAPQALVQTSLVMAAGRQLQPVVLASVLMSLLVMSCKAAEALAKACALVVSGRGSRGFRLALAGGSASVGGGILGVVALCLLKLYMAETCVERLWGLSSGCMRLED